MARRAAEACRPAQRERARRETALRRATSLQPLDHQEAHSPTVAVEILERGEVVSDGRGGISHVVTTRRVALRRLLDARLWGSLTAPEQRAAARIAAGFAILSRGLGAKTSALGRVRIDGTPQEPDYPQDLVNDYLRWGRACPQQGIDRALVMDVIGEGYSCAEADRQRRRRRGAAAAALRAGLALYCRLRGWR